jgi:glutathione S-transferase
MRLYWCAQTRAFRIAWLLEEAAVPYERVAINIRDPASTVDPRFRSASPMGKVPALEDGAVRLWDSGAICAYVADQYSQSGLAPPIGNADRGAYLQWLMFNNSVIEPAMGEKFGGLPANSSRNGWGSWDQMLETLRSRLATGP